MNDEDSNKGMNYEGYWHFSGEIIWCDCEENVGNGRESQGNENNKNIKN